MCCTLVNCLSRALQGRVCPSCTHAGLPTQARVCMLATHAQCKTQHMHGAPGRRSMHAGNVGMPCPSCRYHCQCHHACMPCATAIACMPCPPCCRCHCHHACTHACTTAHLPLVMHACMHAWLPTYLHGLGRFGARWRHELCAYALISQVRGLLRVRVCIPLGRGQRELHLP